MEVLVPTTILSRGLSALSEGCARGRRVNQEAAPRRDLQRPPGCPEAAASPPAELDTWAPHAHGASWMWRPRQGFPRVPHPQNIQGQRLTSRHFPARLICPPTSGRCWEVDAQRLAMPGSGTQLLPKHEVLIACPKPLAALPSLPP